MEEFIKTSDRMPEPINEILDVKVKYDSGMMGLQMAVYFIDPNGPGHPEWFLFNNAPGFQLLTGAVVLAWKPLKTTA